MKRILILGANSAVAKACALQIKEARCYCITRSQASLLQTKKQLQQRYVGGEQLSEPTQESVSAMLTRAQQCLGNIDLVLFAYGYLGDQLLSESEPDEFDAIIEVNFTSVVRYLLLLKPILLAQEAAKIACITSVAGVRGRPRNFSYGAAKGGLSIYLQGLRSALYQSGIEIYDFKLGPVDSPMTITHQKNFSFSKPEKVASHIVHALTKKRYTLFVPGYWYWVLLAVRVMPEWLFQRLGFLSSR